MGRHDRRRTTKLIKDQVRCPPVGTGRPDTPTSLAPSVQSVFVDDTRPRQRSPCSWMIHVRETGTVDKQTACRDTSSLLNKGEVYTPLPRFFTPLRV